MRRTVDNAVLVLLYFTVMNVWFWSLYAVFCSLLHALLQIGCFVKLLGLCCFMAEWDFFGKCVICTTYLNTWQFITHTIMASPNVNNGHLFLHWKFLIQCLLNDKSVAGTAFKHMKFVTGEWNMCQRLNASCGSTVVMYFLVAPLACCEARLNQSGCRVSV